MVNPCACTKTYTCPWCAKNRSMITDGWHKSTFSGGSGCVEARWQTSSFSYGVGECVEVARPAAHVLVRDTKDRTRAPHAHSPAAWRGFLAGIRAGEFGATG